MLFRSRCVAEHHQLCGTDALTISRQLTGLLDGLAHELDGVQMCIRDRMLGDVNSDQPEALLERLKGIFDIVRLVDPESTKAVSYTHLDVYKRQVQQLLLAASSTPSAL